MTSSQQLSLFADATDSDYFDVLQESLTIDSPDTETGIAWPDQFGAALHAWTKSTTRPAIRTLSLFSGLGGLDIAFHDAGFDVGTLLEIDERFVHSLNANVGEEKYLGRANVLCMDVRDFDAAEMDVDFVIGGPPCQSFSAAARRASGVTGINDERGVLFREYARLLSTLKPKGFLFENVYGITGANDGQAWQEIQEAFEEVGYRVFFRLLDAADFGVPQHRERMFIVGVHGNGESFQFPRPTHGPDSRAKRPYYNAQEAVHAAHVDARRQVEGRYSGLLEQVPPGLNYSYFTTKMGHPNPVFSWRSKFSDFLYKADPQTPVRTLKAQGGQYTGPFHWESRPFSVDELKRLQTIPDAYEIVGGRQVAIHQIGNSVPPQLARMLAMAVMDQLFHVPPPAPLDYLSPDEPLGFRTRKRSLTAIYRRKASAAIAKLPKSIRGATLAPRKYEAVLTAKFELRETDRHERGNVTIAFTPEDASWRFDAQVIEERATAFGLHIRPKFQWSLPVADVFLSGNALTKTSFTGVWKAFEAELIRHDIKADLVQLCGYYQYDPELTICCEDLDNEQLGAWHVVRLVCEGKGVRATLNSDDLADIWDVDVADVFQLCTFLKSLGYEVRNSATNPEIPAGQFLIPYAFPTLSAKSVQRRKQLAPANALVGVKGFRCEVSTRIL